MSALTLLWNNRTMVMSVVQLTAASLATSGLLADKSVKWCMFVSGLLTGFIALHNTLKARAAAQENQP